ncbi:MAG: DUF368 domain-containing protein [Planctomycetota bacterium]
MTATAASSEHASETPLQSDLQTDAPAPGSVGLYLRGIAMGVADLIPGVSGGTIALIAGIYPLFVEAISSLNIQWIFPFVRSLFLREPEERAAMRNVGMSHLRRVRWGVLIPIGLGILTSIALGSKLMHYLVSDHPVPTYAFFFGLILISLPIPLKLARRVGGRELAIALVAAVVTFVVVGLPVRDPGGSGLFLFGCGALAISAMVLPGISGSYVLLMLGMFPTVIKAIGDRNLGILVVLASGMVVGLLTFAPILRFLLDRWRSVTLAVLTGIMAGALRSVWPFREIAATVEGKSITRAALPAAFDTSVVVAIGCAALGAGAVLALMFMTRPRPTNTASNA